MQTSDTECEQISARLDEKLVDLEQQVLASVEESQARSRYLEAVIEAITDAVFIYNEQGSIVQMNAAALQLLGLHNADEYVALSPAERSSLLRVCDENGLPVPVEQSGLYRILKGETLTDENKILVILHTLDGREIQASISGTPLYDEQGKIRGAVAVTRDTTERWKMEKQIKALAEAAQAHASHLKAVIDSMVEAVVVYDTNGKLLQMNKAAQQMLGLEGETTAGFSESSLQNYGTYFKMRDEHGKPLSHEEFSAIRALKGEVVRGRELSLTRRDGTTVVIHSSSAPVYTEDGKLIGAVVVALDITERKSIERQKSEFLSIASHELRTPITSIQGFAEILQSLAEKGELATHPRSMYALNEIVRQSNHLNRLIGELLELARIENDRLALHLAEHDLLETVLHVKDIWSLVDKRHTFHLVLDGLEPDVPLMGRFDRDRIEQVLNNLLNNAAKYSPVGSKIEVGIRCREDQPDQALLWVKDEGIGIAPDQLPHIFERFRRSNIDTSISGFGIGLYLVHEFVTRHGGRIWVESTEGQGLTFSVLLPLKRLM